MANLHHPKSSREPAAQRRTGHTLDHPDQRITPDECGHILPLSVFELIQKGSFEILQDGKLADSRVEPFSGSIDGNKSHGGDLVESFSEPRKAIASPIKREINGYDGNPLNAPENEADRVIHHGSGVLFSTSRRNGGPTA